MNEFGDVMGGGAALRQRGCGGDVLERESFGRAADGGGGSGGQSSESVTITLRMDPRMLARIKRLARSRYLNYQSMIKQWLGERLEAELRER